MKRLIQLVLLTGIFAFTNSSQQEVFIREKLANYLIAFPQEKVYMHLDKQYYSPGESIWMKGYVLDAQSHLPQSVSSLLNVELIGNQENVILSHSLEIKDGNAIGDFLLPSDLEPGQYQVRAYTNWMRNFDHDFFFKKEIELLGPELAIDSLSSEEIKVNFQLFPEGGELVDGLAGIVGIKVSDQFGNGVPLKAKLLDSNNSEVAQIKTNQFGLGKFVLTPKKGESYHFAMENDSDVVCDFPDVKPTGYSMMVRHSYTSKDVSITITSSENNLKGSLIVGHQRGKVFTSLVYNGESKSFSSKIPKSSFPTGIVHLTFFDQAGNPKAERLGYFKYDQNVPSLEISQGKESYKKREKALFDFNLSDSAGNPISASTSISITPRESVNQSLSGTNVASYLDISSDLKGRIESPEYYLEQSSEVYADMDKLLLTHGWRRFSWDEVLENEYAKPEHFIENGFMISGQMVHKYNPEKPVSGVVSITYEEGGLNVFEVDTDKDGRFVFYNNYIADSTAIILQAKRVKGKKDKLSNDVRIVLDPTTRPIVQPIFERILVSESEGLKDAYLEQSKKIALINETFNFDEDATLLNEVAIVGYREAEDNPYYRVGTLHGEPSNRVILDSIGGLSGFRGPLEVLRRVPGVRVMGTYPNQTVLIQGQGSLNNNAPLYLLDGAEVDFNTISTISIQDVSHIDILKGGEAAMYGSQASNGVVAVYTRTEAQRVGVPREGILNFDHPGYYQAREFFVPNYDTAIAEHVRPDFRSTLYWNPDVQFVDGSASLDFFTSDQIGDFDIRIEGVSSEGKPIVKSGVMKVR